MFDFHSMPESQVETSSIPLLLDLIKTHRPEYIVEAGTFQGKSARAMAEATDAIIDTIDPCPQCWESDREFDRYPQIAPHLCRAEDFTPRQDIDLLFIDSDPKGRLELLARFVPWLHTGSIVVVDDIRPPALVLKVL